MFVIARSAATWQARDMSYHPTALVTGSAKRLGAVVASHLVNRGYGLVMHYRESGAEAATLEAALRETGGRIDRKQADLAQPESLKSFWNDVPPCELLVLSAASYARDSLASMTAEGLMQQMTVNLLSPLLLVQGFMAQLPEERLGNIIVLGDGAMGWSSSPHFFSYAVSKQAWAPTIDLLAAAVAPRARANLLALGPTLENGDEKKTFERLAARAPLHRTGQPDEVTTAIDFLLSSPGVTGQVISLANGMGLATARPE